MIQTIISKENYDKTIILLKEKYEVLDETGCFFAVTSTEYDRYGNVIHDFFDVISEAVETGYTYVNTIVYTGGNADNASFRDNVKYIVWLCKNRENMTFDKDAIREKHIWKDVEWGKREKNYNPKGKDPGNVWIPTLDDGKAHITKHILLSESEIFARLISMSGCGEDYEIFKTDTANKNTVCESGIERDTANTSKCCKQCDVKADNVSGRIVFGTSEKMDMIEDGCISAAVTSPPYWNLKDYFKKGQIGQESYDEYLSRMKTVWRECYRKLKNDGSLWININIRVRNGHVILIPKDFKKMCREIGFFYKGIFIWHKSSGIPTGDKNIVDRHEYVLVFSKKENLIIDTEIQKSFKDYKNEDICGGAFWNINRKAGSVGKKYIHPAIYPNDLVKRIILMTTKAEETVLDPFLGSGTSLISSLQCGRNFVGYEYNEGFEELMRSRFDRELDGREVIFYNTEGQAGALR